MASCAQTSERTDQERLNDFARRALLAPHFTGILLCAPPGAGKSTLSERLASEIGRPVLRLRHSQLYSARAGDVEAAVEAFFASAVAVAPALVLIDNIDIVAPASVSGPADLRAIAALDAAFDSLSLDHGSFRGLVIVANASNARDVHPALLRTSRFFVHMYMRPPNWSQRKQLLMTSVDEEARRRIAPSEAKSAVDGIDVVALHAELDNIASMTPGFLAADLAGLFSAAVHEIKNSRLGDSDPFVSLTKIVSQMELLAPSIRPTLLLSVDASWHPIRWNPGSMQRLYGLQEQLGLLGSCVRSAFSNCGNAAERIASSGAFQALGAIAGVVLTGPPGSGKTALAQAAVAFLPQGYVNAFYLDSSEIVGSVVGSAEQKLRALFATARATAPTILVIENIDILAHRRGGEDAHGSSSAAAFQRILSTFLVELDGIVQHNRSGAVSENGLTNQGALLVIATTNDISRVDSAILRPGRLELHIELCVPDESARQSILRDFVGRAAPHLLLNHGHVGANSDDWLRTIACSTKGWSAADLHGLCNEAGLSALRELHFSRASQSNDLLTEFTLSQEHFFAAMRVLNIEDIL
jgi:transitional endoplasmic reticulum ATPase